jgi:L-rhamnose-H+ transport protein
MQANPFLGVVLHATGGLAAASFYLPFKRVRGWSWETYWIAGGVFSWLIAPALFALLIVFAIHHVSVLKIIDESPPRAILGAFGFGAAWGIGGLTFGLSMRYLGIALGYAIALGFCAAFGTLIPPVFQGTFGSLMHTTPGLVVLLGVVLCLIGIAFSGMAGMNKERELSAEQKKSSVAEFDFTKGLVIAFACGLLSACMAFALATGAPINASAIRFGVPSLWAGIPTLVVILSGGLMTNLIWCAFLLKKHNSFGEFTGKARNGSNLTTTTQNYVLCALAGITWYFQFFFYTMGSSQMGPRFGFSSWTLHMSSIIIFSTLWGMVLNEWRGTNLKTHWYIATGLTVLVTSTFVVGLGSYLSTLAK